MKVKVKVLLQNLPSSLPLGMPKTFHLSARAGEAAADSVEVVGSHDKGSGNNHGGNKVFLPGTTVATLLMLGTLHARRLYYEKQATDSIREGKEPEFAADFKAAFLQMFPLRLLSRTWGSMMSLELPLWARPYVYKGWARAFKADLSDAEKPLEDYPSLREFFSRGLKKGSRPLDSNPTSLVTAESS